MTRDAVNIVEGPVHITGRFFKIDFSELAADVYSIVTLSLPLMHPWRAQQVRRYSAIAGHASSFLMAHDPRQPRALNEISFGHPPTITIHQTTIFNVP